MEQEFGLKQGWKIFLYITGAIFFIGSLLAFYFSLVEHAPLLVVIYIPILLFSIYFLLGARKCKIIISDYKIVDVGVFTTKQLHIEEVKGYKNDGQNLIIVPYTRRNKPIRIAGYNQLADHDQLLFWVDVHFEDIALSEYHAEIHEINNNPEFGITDEDRESRFKKAKWISRSYNILSVFFVVGVYLFGAENSHLFNVPMLVYPFIGILLLFLNKGVIKIETKEKSRYPYIGIGLILSSMSIVIKAIMSYQITDYHNFWIPCVVVGAILFALLNKVNVKASGAIDKNQILMIILITSACAYGVPVIVNCDFDTSAATVAPVTILDQHKLTGKITTYVLTVGPWGTHTEANDVDVSQWLYSEVSPGDKVNVNIKRGSLKIPWFYISR
jgi:hypothetical protein